MIIYNLFYDIINQSAHAINLLIIIDSLSTHRLDENLVVKISDFGLSKDINEKEYYRAEDKTIPPPVRWLSIEAIKNNVFKTHGDVVCIFCYMKI